jgi:hypothetical protein
MGTGRNQIDCRFFREFPEVLLLSVKASQRNVGRPIMGSNAPTQKRSLPCPRACGGIS